MKKIFNYLLCTLCCASLYAQNTNEDITAFINKNKNRCAVYLTENDSVLVHINENKLMPLASTVNILIALEYAKQVAKGTISEGDMIALSDIDRYYIPNTDGGAHQSWLAYEKNSRHIIGDSIQLVDVARGMMMYNSNANTEYLIELLGLDNVNENISILGLTAHGAIYPPVASLFMYQSPKNNSEKEILKGMKKLSEEQYCRYIFDIHKALAYDTILKQKYRLDQFTTNMQEAWSQRLTASTTKDYARLANILNSRSYFDADTYAALSPVVETLMENINNKQKLKNAAIVGGRTKWVITKLLYSTNKQGKRIAMAYFFNNLTLQENIMLNEWTEKFDFTVLNDDEFRAKLKVLLPN